MILAPFVLSLVSVIPPAPPAPDDLLTVAESSDFQATATHAEVTDLARRIAKRSPRVHLTEMGTTAEGRSIPLLVIADPPVTTATEARLSRRTIVFAFGNIHAGEVCGKEALLMLARELALAPQTPWLDEVIVLLVPNYNADGNERMSPDNRPGQVGPARGTGQRPNAQGLDLNRDYVKLEAPETQALVRLFNEWDPHVTIDTHTTNGSHHRYTLTFDGPLSPAGAASPRAYIRETMLPEVSRRLAERTGYLSFFYGNFNAEHTAWSTYSPLPRYGANYQGLRGQMSILSEAHAYASYRDRVLCTLEFVREILQFASEQGNAIRQMHDDTHQIATHAGRNPAPDDVVGLRFRPAASHDLVTILGYEQKPGPDGRPVATERPRDYMVLHRGGYTATLSVRRPHAYLIPPQLETVVENLRRHGVEVEPFAGPAQVERYTIRGLSRDPRPFQGHQLRRVEVDCAPARANMPPGSWIVRTAQPLGTLAVTLLEPQSEDGLAAWNFLDDHLEIGQGYPITRVQWERDLGP